MQAELFPFLSVLACMIGSLVLIIIIVTSSALGSQRSITLVARDEKGNNLELVPRILEVRADGVLLHGTNEFVAVAQVGRPGTALRRLLTEVAARSQAEYVILAVRPDGYATFEKVREQVEDRGIQIGYEPIDADWRVRTRR